MDTYIYSLLKKFEMLSLNCPAPGRIKKRKIFMNLPSGPSTSHAEFQSDACKTYKNVGQNAIFCLGEVMASHVYN